MEAKDLNSIYSDSNPWPPAHDCEHRAQVANYLMSPGLVACSHLKLNTFRVSEEHTSRTVLHGQHPQFRLSQRLSLNHDFSP